MDQSQINLLEIIGDLYIRIYSLQKQNVALTELLHKRSEEHAQLIELTNKISVPSFSGEK